MAEKKEVKPRREYGEGSIYQRKSDGRHVGSFYVDGERKSVYGDTHKEAKAKLKEAQSQAEQGTLIASNKQKLAEYLSYWISIRKLEVEPVTVYSYTSSIASQIVPALGSIQLQKLTQPQIQRWITAMDENDLAATTIRLAYVILHEALKDAVKWKLISTNPCTDTVLVKLQQHEMHVLDIDQVQCFLASLQGHKYEALFVLAVTTGMRKGELLGLKWSDIDVQAARLQVKRTLAFINRVGYSETDPKTKSSKRSITLTPLAVDVLKEHRTRQRTQRMQANTWQNTDLVFTQATGTYLPHKVVNYNLRVILERAHLPGIRVHDLRHTCATLLLQMGTHPKVVQELLGHSSIKITMDLYSHVLPNMQGDTMQSFNSFLTTKSLKKGVN